MRYVAKLYVTDVMDQVVVSGYVFDADQLSNPDHDTWEFTYQTPGLGLDEPAAWLLNALYRCLVSEESPRARRGSGASPVGGSYTISETGDTRRRVKGSTAGGGAARRDAFRSRSDSAQVAGKPA